jgi:hypothetical protein
VRLRLQAQQVQFQLLGQRVQAQWQVQLQLRALLEQFQYSVQFQH